MTNDFAVVDQQQTRKSPLWPTVGAVGGGIAGYAIANRKGAKSYEDLIKEVKDTTDFSTKENKDVWQSVKDKLAEVDELQKKFDAASTKTVTGTELDELNAAKEALQKEIERLQALEGETTEIIGGVNNKKGFMSFEKARNKFGKEAVPEYYVNDAGKVTKKKIPLKDVEQLYKDMTAESDRLYQKALSSIQANTDKKAVISDIETLYSDMQAEVLAKMTAKPKNKESILSRYYSERTFRPDAYSEKEFFTDGYKRCKAFADKQIERYPDRGLKDADIVEIGREYKFGDKLERGEIKMDATVKNSKGNLERKTFIVNIEEMRDMRQRRIAEIKEQRIELADKIFANAAQAQDIATRKATLKTTGWKEFVDRGLAKQTGLLTKAGGVEELNIALMLAEDSQYKADIAALEKMYKGKAIVDDALVSKYSTTSITGASKEEIESALETVRARKSVVRQYNDKLKSLDKEYQKCISDNSVVEKLDKKITEELARDKKLARFNKKLAAQFPGIFGDAETTVTKAGKTITADDVAQSFRDKVAEKQKLYDKAVAERGTINEEAKKAAEEALNKGKTELKELAEKLGKGGTKGKVIGAIIGVAAGAGLLGLLAPKKPKNA